MRRSSNSRKAFKRKHLLFGVPKNAFYLLLLAVVILLVFQQYKLLPAVIVIWWFFKFLTNKDPDWMKILESYSKEKDIYDSLPRKSVWDRLPFGWGKGLPW